MVAKVAKKILAFCAPAGDSVGLKCGGTREEADPLIAEYPEDVSVMAYIGHAGWNTIWVGGAVPDDEVLELIDESYDRVVAKLPKSRRSPLQ